MCYYLNLYCHFGYQPTRVAESLLVKAILSKCYNIKSHENQNIRREHINLKD